MISLTFGVNPLKTKKPKKLVGTITYEPLVGLLSNLVWLFSRLGISDDLISSWDESIKNKMAAAAL